MIMEWKIVLGCFSVLIGCASAKKVWSKSENTDTRCGEYWQKHLGGGRSCGWMGKGGRSGFEIANDNAQTRCVCLSKFDLLASTCWELYGGFFLTSSFEWLCWHYSGKQQMDLKTKCRWKIRLHILFCRIIWMDFLGVGDQPLNRNCHHLPTGLEI